jgi:hypothetical protein
MASLSKISLSLSDETTANTRSVTVSGLMSFNKGDVGKIYRLYIRLVGEDKPGDVLPTSDPVGDDIVSTFFWKTPFGLDSYVSAAVSATGPHKFTETRGISKGKLDEDSGEEKTGEADINTPFLVPRQDEVYAKVWLWVPPSPLATARSATAIANVGV